MENAVVMMIIVYSIVYIILCRQKAAGSELFAF